jgi:hypothetical protein
VIQASTMLCMVKAESTGISPRVCQLYSCNSSVYESFLIFRQCRLQRHDL